MKYNTRNEAISNRKLTDLPGTKNLHFYTYSHLGQNPLFNA